MVSMLAWSVVDRGFKPRSGQTKDYEIGIYWGSVYNNMIHNHWLIITHHHS